MKKLFLGIFGALSIAALTSGCAQPQMNVQAESGRPHSAEVPMVSISYNPDKPRYVFIVQPFESSSNVISYTQGEAGQVPIGDKMAAQLVTALSRVGNFVLYDYKSAAKIKLRKGEVGPYLVKATLTEFNENAEAASEDNGFSLGGVGAVMGIAGAVADKPGLMWTGAGLAAANPGIESKSSMKKGMVAFDLQISEKNSGRIISSFEASGTFKAQSNVNGYTLFGYGNRKAQFASSALGQALRVAMNDAAQKTYDAVR